MTARGADQPPDPDDPNQPPDPDVENLVITGESDRRGDGTTDIIESEPEPGWLRRLPHIPRAPAISFALAIVVAAAAGYVVGTKSTTTAAPGAPSPSTGPASPTTGNPTTDDATTNDPTADEPIAGTGRRCGVQLGGQLQLGIEVTNRSTMPVAVQRPRARLPLNGLKPTTSTWGTCGQVSSVADGGRDDLPAGATTWLTITFDVLIPCPGALHVGFRINYTQEGRPGVADLPGFNDLGDVPYTSKRCPTG